MKIDPAISAKLAVLQPNHVGLLAWSLLAHPSIHAQIPLHAGGVPHQPDPDTPQPAEPGEHPPMEPGEPTLPDEPPPTPVA